MRKILVVLLIAGVLALALSVPALAGKVQDSLHPNAWGQYHKDANARLDEPLGQVINNFIKPIDLPLKDLTWSQINSQKIFP